VTKSQLQGEARLAAVKHGLDPALVCAVCEQESSWDTWAYRYEPAFERRYCPGRPIAATSFGLMQVMALVAEEMGFEGGFTRLCDPQEGLEAGCRKLKQCLTRAKGDVETALLRYNGGGNPKYPGEVLARKPNYELIVQAAPAIAIE